MTEPNWGLIRTGATFEALVATLVFFEDRSATLFGRPGPDGGQDVRSGDGALIYQAKFHRNESARLAIADALEAAKAAAKIVDDPSHPRHGQWKGVQQWKLVTNAQFGPNDEERWNEVRNAFGALKIDATYWAQRDLNVRIIQQPEVYQSFFEGKARSLLTLPEAWDAVAHDVVFLPRALRTPLKGREDELQRVAEFLDSDARYLVVTGPGGVGKTRFLLEAGTNVAAPARWQVLWANLARLAGGDWYGAIVPERNTLLLVDEPQDERELTLIVDEVKNTLGRAAKWKVGVTVRSPNDPVRRFLTSPRLARHTSLLELQALPPTASEELVLNLIESGSLRTQPADRNAKSAEQISKLYNRFPVWLSLAVELLEKEGDLSKVPATAEGLATEYLEEVFRKQSEYSRETLERTLRAVALVRTLNVEDPVSMAIVEEISGLRSSTSVLACIEHLHTRRVLSKRGVTDRLIEIKPDVLRDQVLRSWLLLHVTVGGDRWIPTDAANELAQKAVAAVSVGRVDQLTRSILRALARTETLFRIAGEQAPLLKRFFGGLHAQLPVLKAGARLVAAQILPDVASAQPESVAALVQQLRVNACEPEKTDSLFGSRQVTQEDVLLALAWPVYLGARTSLSAVERKATLNELCALTRAEHEALPKLKHGLPNDGKRAAQLIAQVVGGGPEFWSNFDAEVLQQGLALLDQLHSGDTSEAAVETLRVLMRPALSLERQWTTSDNSTITFSRHTLLTAAEGWKNRKLLIERMRSLLVFETDATVAAVFWDLLGSAHHSANQARSALKEHPEAELLRRELLDDLEWTYKAITARKPRTEELSAARSVWDWDRKYGKDEAIRSAAQKLEELYLEDNIAGEFQSLVEVVDLETHDRSGHRKATELAEGGDAAVIDGFVSRALAFLGRSDLRRILHVAHALGPLAAEKASVAAFVRAALREPAPGARAEFAAKIARGWLGAVRKRDSAEALALAKELVGLTPDDLSKASLLADIYWNHSIEHSGALSRGEHSLLREAAAVFRGANRGQDYLEILGPTFHEDWSGYKDTVKAVLNELPEGSASGGFSRLLHGIYLGVRWNIKQERPAPPDLFSWLLDLIIMIPDVDAGGNAAWYLGELQTLLGPVSITWFADAIQRRVVMHNKGGKRVSFAPSTDDRWTQFVRPLERDSIESERSAISSLLALRHESGGVAYNLPQYLVDVDPYGLLVPQLVVEIAQSHVANYEELHQCARIGGAYALDSDPWRTIASAVITAAQRLDQRARVSIFLALGDPRPKLWSGVPGKVAPVFISAVEDSRRRERENQTLELREFWRWARETAEAELDRQTEELKEEEE